MTGLLTWQGRRTVTTRGGATVDAARREGIGAAIDRSRRTCRFRADPVASPAPKKR
jgi:hypothetical protein